MDGKDKDKDGELEDAEISTNEILCNGKSIVPMRPRLFGSESVRMEEKLNCESTNETGTSCNEISVDGLPVLLGDAAAFCEQRGFIYYKTWVTRPAWRDRKFYKWDEIGQGWVFTDLSTDENASDVRVTTYIECATVNFFERY